MANYHYEYYWLCVDMCSGGVKRGDYKDLFTAKLYKPQRGIWQLRHKRIANSTERV